ncbi:MAG: orotate phosphoribosyltransferase [Desulfurococcales archaeon]|nr:orotate phosphoribosyltransferase [Desulfurococcales archaeon]
MPWFVKEFFRAGIIKFGHFRLSSGAESPYYIDLRRLYSFPELAYRVIDELIAVIRAEYDAVVGVATAGIPLAAYIGFRRSIPMGYVRVQRKTHGLESKVEGVLEGRKVLVVDDVATTGQSLASAAETLKSLKADVAAAAAIVDREQGAEELLKAKGIPLYSLIKVTDMFRELLQEGLIDEETFREVMEYTERFRKGSF